MLHNHNTAQILRNTHYLQQYGFKLHLTGIKQQQDGTPCRTTQCHKPVSPEAKLSSLSL